MRPTDYWQITTLYALGVIAGLCYLQWSSPSCPPGPLPAASFSAQRVPQAGMPSAEDPPWAPALEEIAPDPERIARRMIEDGDLLLMASQVAAAAKCYRRAQHGLELPNSDLSLRLGFCAELEHEYSQASNHYQRALLDDPTPLQRWLARSGLSRILIEQGRPDEGLLILSDLFFEQLTTPTMPPEIQTQILYQLGTTYQDTALKGYHHELHPFDGIAFHAAPPPAEPFVQLLRGAEKRLEALMVSARQGVPSTPQDSAELVSDDPLPRIRVLQRPSSSVDLTIVEIRSPHLPLSQLLSHVAASCELKLFASPDAQALLAGRSKAIDVESIQLGLVLDALLLPIDLVWHQNEQGLQVHTLAEHAGDEPRYWAAAAERTWRKLNVMFHNDQRSTSALLARGNLQFLQGDLDRAATHYHELLQFSPKGEILAKVFFNVGKVEMRLGRTDQAIRHYYLAIDQSHQAALQSSAYWLIGQLCLEANRLPEAVKSAGRALNLARTDIQRRQAALTMARAYLLSNQPLAANQTLYNEQRVFAGTRLEPTAAILGSFARYVGMTDPNNLKWEANRLLSAIASAPDEHFESFLDVYLAARAWQELGFRAQAIEKLTMALESTTIEAWRRQFLFELGVQLALDQQTDRAAAVFEYLLEGSPDGWWNKSLIQLAQIHLNRGQSQECLALCKQYLSHDPEDKELATVLSLMGRSYRQLGEHYAAALCFSGIAPVVAPRALPNP